MGDDCCWQYVEVCGGPPDCSPAGAVGGEGVRDALVERQSRLCLDGQWQLLGVDGSLSWTVRLRSGCEFWPGQSETLSAITWGGPRSTPDRRTVVRLERSVVIQ